MKQAQERSSEARRQDTEAIVVRQIRALFERMPLLCFWPGYTAGEELYDDLPDTTETVRREELDRALRLLERGREPAGVLEELSRRLMNKLLHAPTKALLEES